MYEQGQSEGQANQVAAWAPGPKPLRGDKTLLE
jgi:hypothetical protein